MSRQESGVCSGVNFLLHHRVLYEISAFGLQDSAEKVSKGIHLIYSGSHQRRNFCVTNYCWKLAAQSVTVHACKYFI